MNYRFRDDKDQEKLRLWFENNEKALAVMQEASQELFSRGLIVDPQIFHSAVQHQTLHALGELYTDTYCSVYRGNRNVNRDIL